MMAPPKRHPARLYLHPDDAPHRHGSVASQSVGTSPAEIDPNQAERASILRAKCLSGLHRRADLRRVSLANTTGDLARLDDDGLSISPVA